MTTNAIKLIDQLGVTQDGWPAWLQGLQSDAAAALRETGLPHKRVEGWRFTPLRPLTSGEFAPAEQAPNLDRWQHVYDQYLANTGKAWIVPVVNGTLLPSPTEAPAGVRVSSLRDALAAQPDLIKSHLGGVAAVEHFAALNAALFSDGLVIEVDRGAAVDTPVHIVHVTEAGSEDTVCYPRVLVIAQPNARVRVIESYLVAESANKSVTNPVTEVVVEQDAHVDHVRIQVGTKSSSHVAALAAKVGRSGVYASRVVTLGGALCRLDLRVDLAGIGGETIMDGVYYAGKGEHVDHRTYVDHQVPQCTSSENYRGILDGNGHAVWDGMAVVRRGAIKTAAHQQNRNLLLSDDATVNTKPHLEIDTDDLVASHGATVGALDQEQLFYLRSRGLEETQARAALTYAFVQELLDGVPHEQLASRIGAHLRDRLPGGDTIGEFLS